MWFDSAYTLFSEIALEGLFYSLSMKALTTKKMVFFLLATEVMSLLAFFLLVSTDISFGVNSLVIFLTISVVEMVMGMVIFSHFIKESNTESVWAGTC